MQHSSGIITSSDALSRKLSFQGWEKCVEAFSQGKGSLSHHCTRLMHPEEASHQEGLISWSSSDGESDEPFQSARIRPNRTLSSQIDFGDCTSIRKKGRRHTSARFSRSIEKQALKSMTRNKSLKVQVQDGKQIEKDSSTLADSSMSFFSSTMGYMGHCSYNKYEDSTQTSLLNKRIVLSDDSQNSEVFIGSRLNYNETLTSDTSQEKSNHSKVEITSPIFKTARSVPKKKSFVIPQKDFVKSNVIKRAPGPSCKIKLPFSMENNELVENESVCDGQRSPDIIKNKSFEACSPVLGRSVGRRRKCTPKMAIDEALSPILGKVKESPLVRSDKSPILGASKKILSNKRRKKGTANNASENSKVDCKQTNTSNVNNCFKSEQKKSEPPSLLPKWSLEEANSESLEDDAPPNSEVISAKRSLDFSASVHLGSKLKDKSILKSNLNNLQLNYVDEATFSVTNEFVSSGPDSDVIESSQCKPSYVNINREELGNHNQYHVKNSVGCLTLSTTIDGAPQTPKIHPQRSEKEAVVMECSQIIEEENTEQVQDNSNEKSLKPEFDPKKKKRSLSLRKKPVICGLSNIGPQVIESKHKMKQSNLLSNADGSAEISFKKNHDLQLHDTPLKSKTNLYNAKKEVVPNTCVIEDDVSPINPEKRTGSLIQGSISNSMKRRSYGALNKHKADSRGKILHNFTCYIEDVNSEAPDFSPHVSDKQSETEFNSLEQGRNGLPAEPQLYLSKRSPFHNIDDLKQQFTKGFSGSCEDVPDIDSCSSQSPEDIQPSRAVSPPISISQSSSPPAPQLLLPFARPSGEDDFNAPPKKGRNKLQAGGLANRLHRLLNRQRSSTSIWHYQRSKQGLNKPDSTNSINSGTLRENDGTLIKIHRSWIEFSHVLVEGSLEKVPMDKNILSSSVIVVLDLSVADRLGKIMTASVIRIFPPWQSVTIKGTSVILCATCVEVVPTPTSSRVPKKKLILFKEFHCSCADGLSQQSCSEHSGLILGVLNDRPVKFLDLFFPEVQQDATCCLTWARGGTLEVDERRPNSAQESVSQLVTNHCSGSTNFYRLSVTILRVFKFWQLARTEPQDNLPSWSLLARDAVGDMCEIALGTKSSSKIDVWKIVESGKMLGGLCQFSGLIPTKRISPFRASNLWSVAHSITSGSCDQAVLYVLSPSVSSWHCKIIQDGDGQDGLHFSELRDVIAEFQKGKKMFHYLDCCKGLGLHSDIESYTLSLGCGFCLIEDTDELFKSGNAEPHRFNIICRLLHSSSELLYVTDNSITPHVSVIKLQPSTYLPPTLTSSRLILLQDIEFAYGEIRADKYSTINVIDLQDKREHPVHSVEQLRYLMTLNPEMPQLHINTPPKNIAALVGVIVGVDEESAFMWPACDHCGNELLCVEDGSESYSCGKCNDRSAKVVLKMSLHVIVSCKNLPQQSVIRVKLLQSTIEKLLPSSLSSEGGYDMNTVLGCQLGPLNCEVLLSQGGNFVLQELSPFIL